MFSISMNFLGENLNFFGIEWRFLKKTIKPVSNDWGVFCQFTKKIKKEEVNDLLFYFTST